MAATDQAPDSPEDAPKKKGMLVPLIIGLVLAGIGGGGGFFAVSTGMIGGAPTEEAETEPELLEELAEVGFVPLSPIIVDLGRGGGGQILRFRGEVEVEAGYEDEVTEITPRIIDVMNGYLRAVDPIELQEPAALLRLRAQLLRRVQMVAGEGRVRDLLVMEFVLN